MLLIIHVLTLKHHQEEMKSAQMKAEADREKKIVRNWYSAKHLKKTNTKSDMLYMQK